MNTAIHAIATSRTSRWGWRAGLPIVLVLAGVLSSATAQPVDPVVNGEALVRLHVAADIAAFNARHGSTTLDAIASRHIYRLQIPAGVDPFTFQQQVNADPDAVWCELNYFGQTPEARGRCFYFLVSPDAQGYINQPAWDQVSRNTALQTADGTGTVVAIVDTGVDATHIALQGAVLTTGWNFVDGNANTADVGNGLDDDGDGFIDEGTGHGTHVAGVVSFLAPQCMVLPVKVLDSDGNSTNFLVAAGIFYAIDQGVSVINVSIGSTYNSPAVVDAVTEATNRGIPVIAAAGNMDVRTPLEYPALNAGVIGVAAVNAQDIKSDFSNYHELLALSAPGSGIISTLPGNLYAAWNGTSMATPMVSAAAALVLSRHPEWPADLSRVNNVRQALTQSADPIDSLNPPFAGMLGAGRLNAGRAVLVQEAFAPAAPYTVGAAPQAVAVADLNGDGHPDLAVADSGASAVSVLLNTGYGNFAPAQSYPCGVAPLAIAAADFDHDGDKDLVILSGDSRELVILANNGSGEFTAGATYPAGAGAIAMVAADLTGDGWADLAIADENDNAVRVFRNLHNGTFTLHATLPVGARPVDLIAVDVDHNNSLDLVTANRNDDTISVLQNSGNGTFGVAHDFPVGQNPRSLTCADFNGDGHFDLATANHNSNDVTIVWNNGAGVFSLPNSITITDQRRPERVASADLNCDGHADLIATNLNATTELVSVLLGRGDGTFLAAVDYPAGSALGGVTATDAGGDGHADICVTDPALNIVTVLLSRSCVSALTGDMNCDGRVSFADIDPFVAALEGRASYEPQFPECRWINADCNADGRVTFGDIDPFVALLGG